MVLEVVVQDPQGQMQFLVVVLQQIMVQEVVMGYFLAYLVNTKLIQEVEVQVVIQVQ